MIAYVPRYGALVTLSRAPRETAVFPVHCSHSSLPGRYASAAYHPAGGGTTGNMPRIPGGGSWNVAICCGPASSLFVGSVFRYGSHWFAMLRFGVTRRPSRIVALCRAAMRRYAPVRGDPPHWLAMARYDTPGVRRFTSPSPVGGGTGPDMARILPASRPGREKTHLHRSPVVADLASPRRSTPPARRKGVIGRVVGWGCLLVIFRGGKIRGLIRSGSQDPEIRSIGKGGVAFALFPLPGAFFCRFGPVSSCLLWNTRR